MNRKERRSLLKKGFTKSEISLLDALSKPKNKLFKNGTRVKLKYEDIIKTRNGLGINVEKYLEFVEDNKDKVLTLEEYESNDQLFTFEEDNNEVKFLFHEFELEYIDEE